MSVHPLEAVAKAMVAPGKGILAADESVGTANKRFAPLGIPETEEMRRAYREMLFTAPGFGDNLSGVILFDETIRQNRKDGVSFVKTLEEAGSLPGIKLDKGLVPQALAPNEQITEGLDGLPQRVDEYVKMGAKFAKWRAVINIGDGLPTTRGLRASAHGLARYAAICQAGGLVPIVEPEVLMDGGRTHTLERSFEVHEETLRIVFEELAEAGVVFERMILKPSMVIPGEKSTQKASASDVAAATVTVLKRWVPGAVPGIAFLSGGQADEEATFNLNEVNRYAQSVGQPWPLTFSYGRALQHEALTTWNGKDENVPAAQAALIKHAKENGLAALGKFSAEHARNGALAGTA
jgi:fructose-bisphosphate aldolase class I